MEKARNLDSPEVTLESKVVCLRLPIDAEADATLMTVKEWADIAGFNVSVIPISSEYEPGYGNPPKYSVEFVGGYLIESNDTDDFLRQLASYSEWLVEKV